MCNVALLVATTCILALPSCSGLSQQYRTSKEGFHPEYVPHNETIADPKGSVYIVDHDSEFPVRVFNDAIKKRMSTNGIRVAERQSANEVVVDLDVTDFKIDFRFGKWVAKVGYSARIDEGSRLLCEKRVHREATAFNVYGYGSGQKALNEAFSNAIDALDLNACFSKAR